MLSLPQFNFSEAGCVCDSCTTAETKKKADALAAEHAQLLGELFTEWAYSEWGPNARGWTREEIEKIWQLAENRCKTFGVPAINVFERFTLDRGAVHGIQAHSLPGVWRELFQIDGAQ
jgi:hypothetical protein